MAGHPHSGDGAGFVAVVGPLVVRVVRVEHKARLTVPVFDVAGWFAALGPRVRAAVASEPGRGFVEILFGFADRAFHRCRNCGGHVLPLSDTFSIPHIEGVSLPDIHAYATRPHYAAHLIPIVNELEARGHNIIRSTVNGQMPDPGELCLVASGADMATIPGRRIIYVEHGAGQTYNGFTGPGYPGGTGHDDVVLFVCPNDTVADKWTTTYPDTETVVAGCPMLDRWHTLAAELPDPARPVIAVTFHWPSSLCEETMTAWPVYSRAIHNLVEHCLKHGWGLIGHEHPRWETQMLTEWKLLNIPTASYTDVMNTATLLVADNTSMLPEFASTGRPVMFLNSPGYRRDVNHGCRFWEWPEGQVSVDEQSGLVPGVIEALEDPQHVQAARSRMVDSVYAFTDGNAAERAADAIEGLL